MHVHMNICFRLHDSCMCIWTFASAYMIHACAYEHLLPFLLMFKLQWKAEFHFNNLPFAYCLHTFASEHLLPLTWFMHVHLNICFRLHDSCMCIWTFASAYMIHACAYEHLLPLTWFMHVHMNICFRLHDSCMCIWTFASAYMIHWWQTSSLEWRRRIVSETKQVKLWENASNDAFEI